MLSLLSRQSANKNYSNPFRIRIFLFLAYSFGIETINTFIHSVVPSKTIPDSRPIWAKCKPVFRPKRRKTPTRWGGIYLYGLYKGVPPLPGDNSLFRVGCTGPNYSNSKTFLKCPDPQLFKYSCLDCSQSPIFLYSVRQKSEQLSVANIRISNLSLSGIR